MKEKIKFGEVTMGQLLDAFGVVSDVLKFIQENRQSTDIEAKETARMAFTVVMIDDMVKHRIVAEIARDEAEKILNKEQAHETKQEPAEAGSSFAFPLRPASDKS